MIKMNEEVKITCSNDIYKYSPDQLYDKFDDLQTREQKLQNNWNELKKWIEEELKEATWSASGLDKCQKKMQELEQGKDENNQ